MNKILPAILCGSLALFLLSCTKEKSIAVTSVSVSQATAEMLIGESVQLNVTVLPSDATDKTVLWASSKQSVATVSSSGMVIAIAEGVSTITASSGGFSATCVVTVSKRVIPVSSVELNKTSLTLVKGTTEALSATVKPNDATDPKVTWSSSNTAIASVDNDGRVTAFGGGEATIFAKAGEKEAKCIVTVTVPVASVSMNKETITLIEGESEVLVATIDPEDATDKTITWSSSNAQIAAVGDDGKVIAVKEGEATITAKAGDKSATCKVKVSAPYIPVSGISLNKSSLELKKGNSETLVATVSPNNATEPVVTWNSSNESVAKVDQEGKVTALNSGTATITAKAGNYSATCEVTVVIPVTGVTIDNLSLTLSKGASSKLVAKVYPEDATNKTVIWSSDNTGVATVTDGTIVAVGGGVTEIRVKTQDGGFTATCTVTVQVPVQSVSLNKTSVDMYQYDEVKLTATVYPSDATNKALTWSSSKTSVATVDSNGKVTGVSGGSATITVKTTDGGYTAQCYVKVTADGHQAVDLGLSVKWATTNFGTSSNTATGGYYFYGDPTGTGVMTEYTAPDVSATSGTQYDIVRKNWGGDWRIPTRSELGELYTKCTWKLETISNVSVFRVTGPNGNSILVPPSGVAYPASGPIGTTAIYAGDKAYLMSGNSYSDQYGRFVYVYSRSPDGTYNWESYNVNLAKFTVRPVR